MLKYFKQEMVQKLNLVTNNRIFPEVTTQHGVNELEDVRMGGVRLGVWETREERME